MYRFHNAIKSYSAFVSHERQGGLRLLIKNPSLLLNDIEHRADLPAPLPDVFGGVNDYVHRPFTQAEEHMDFVDTPVAASCLHLNENVEIAIRPRVAPRITAEQDDPSRIAMLHDGPGDGLDQRFFNVSQ